MKKVLVIGGFAPSLINFRGKMLEAFLEDDTEVFTCAGESTDEVNRELKSMGVTHFPIVMQRIGTSVVGDLQYMFQLMKIVKTVKPSFIVSYTIKPVVYGGLVARLLKIPFFPLITGLGYVFMPAISIKHKLVAFVSKRLYKFALGRAHKVFFQNCDDQQLFLDFKILSQKVDSTLVNGSGVDLSHFEEYPLPKKPIFLLVARLLRDKGIHEYVKAAKIVKEQCPTAIFQLLGPFDSNPAALTELEIKVWEKEGALTYLGQSNDVRPFIQGCRFYVLPSYREGTPRTVLEAMAIGRPIITTDVPGCRQTIVDKEQGLLVKSHHAGELAEAMLWMIMHEAEIECMAKKARERVECLYDVHKVNEKILSEIKMSLN